MGGLDEADLKLFEGAAASSAAHPGGAIAIGGADGNVECELHLWAYSEQCEMDPLRGYYKFSFTKGGKEEAPPATLMKYDVKLSEDGKKTVVAHVSPASKNGWSAAGPMWYP